MVDYSQVTGLIRDISHPALGRVVLGHLSSDCNTPEIILASLRNCLSELGHGHVELHCAGQHEPSTWFDFQASLMLAAAEDRQGSNG